MKVKEVSEKFGLKLKIQKTKIMASGPSTSWEIDGETVETVSDFILGGLQNHCRWWLQTWKTLTPWKESYDQPRQHIEKRDITLSTKVRLVMAMFFPVVVCGCELDHKESWALKNWCFWIVVLEKTIESPLTARRSNQSILKEISPGCSMEGLILKLKPQCLGHLMRRADSFVKTLMLGKIKCRRRMGMTEDKMVGWHHQFDGHGFGWPPGVGDGQGGLECCGSWGRKESDTTKRLNWTIVQPVKVTALIKQIIVQTEVLQFHIHS